VGSAFQKIKDMETKELRKVSVNELLKDIRLEISWSKISRRYFDKSVSWFYNKMSGIDGNGGDGEFTYEEKLRLRNALYDFADRVKKSADSLI
jgi:hypothetical protein